MAEKCRVIHLRDCWATLIYSAVIPCIDAVGMEAPGTDAMAFYDKAKQAAQTGKTIKV